MSKDPEAQALASKQEKDPLVADSSNHSSNDEDEENTSILRDAKDTLVLGVPIFLAMLSWVGMKTTDSALLGHVSAQALAAAALSDLWTMCTVVLINARVLGVLCGAAVGAGNPKLAGIYLQVSYYVLAYVVLFVFVCWYFTEQVRTTKRLCLVCCGCVVKEERVLKSRLSIIYLIKQVWLAFGSEPHLAKMAGFYAKALAWSLPAQLAVGQLTQFFSSQRIMYPEVNASAVALVMNLVFGLILVLGIPIPGWHGFGFPACPIVTTGVTYVQLFVLYFVYIYIQRLHEPCWGGWAWKEITRERIWTFCELYVPAALGAASDFWRVAVIGGVAAKLGDVEVAVFNTSYRIMWIVLIMVNALSTASGIKTSRRLGKMDHVGAKQAGWVGIHLSALILLFIGGFVFWKIRFFGRIFTEDEEFLALFEEAKLPFTLTLILMNMSVAIERIPYSMGRTKEVFWFGFGASWGAQVPGVFVLTTYWRDDLVGLYWGMVAGYLVLSFLYTWIVVRSDWKMYAELARQRSEISDE